MASFQYEATDRRGRGVRGVTMAGSLNEALAGLRNQGMLVLSLQPTAGSAAASSFSLAAWLPIRSLDVELSLHQLAVMLRSGLSLLHSLQTVAQQAERVAMRRTWEDVITRIENGESLAEAMQQHRCFPRLIIQLVRVGEQTGILDYVLRRGAENMANRRQLTTQTLTALAYPAIVLVAALGISAFLVLYVIPKIKVFLDALGRKLPWMTQMLVDFAQFSQTNLIPGIAVLFLLTAFMTMLYLAETTRIIIDRAMLRVPIVGKVLRLAGTAIFARTMAILLRSGITLVEALRTTETLLSNRWLGRTVQQARSQVIGGGTLAAGLAVPRTFMPMLASMTAVGESAGTLDEVMEEVAIFHEDQLAAAIRRLSVLIEPAIIVVVGGIVGFVYTSFFMALFAAGGAR